MSAWNKFCLVVERNKALKLSINRSEKVLDYGTGNVYPQLIDELISASKTASASIVKMSENIVCEGFKTPAFAVKTNLNGQDMNDILDSTSLDIARFNGWAWIVQYREVETIENGELTVRYEEAYVYPVPFEYVRAVAHENIKKDPKIYQWAVFNNWDKTNVKETNSLQNATVYPTYNPRKFAEEVQKVGGIENHKGQLLYVNLSTSKPYPLSCFHAVQPEMGAEAKNGVYINRTLGRGFHMCSIVTHGSFETDQEKRLFQETIEDMMGSDNAGSVLTIEDGNAALDKPFIKVDQVGTPLQADLYKAYCEPLRKDIAIAAYNLPIPLIDSSLIAFSNSSGEVIKEMQKIYRKALAKTRARISRELAGIFDVSTSITEINNQLDEPGIL